MPAEGGHGTLGIRISEHCPGGAGIARRGKGGCAPNGKNSTRRSRREHSSCPVGSSSCLRDVPYRSVFGRQLHGPVRGYVAPGQPRLRIAAGAGGVGGIAGRPHPAGNAGMQFPTGGPPRDEERPPAKIPPPFAPGSQMALYGSIQWASRLRTLLEMMRSAMGEPEYPAGCIWH